MTSAAAELIARFRTQGYVTALSAADVETLVDVYERQHAALARIRDQASRDVLGELLLARLAQEALQP